MSDPLRKTGVLLVNLGTPEAPTTSAVRRYLAEFLSDPRVVEIPRPIWRLILHGVVLRVRPRKSAKAYQAIWTERGSPLMYWTQDLTQAVAEELGARGWSKDLVVFAMRYGQPSIPSRLQSLRDRGVEEMVILPLYPQYAAATTASIFDKTAQTFRAWRYIPSIRFISDYYSNPDYVEAVCASIREYWRAHGKGRMLLMSFHGLPERCRDLGDPYPAQCAASAKAIARGLGLGESEWTLAFQSRFGPAQWIKPYCVDVLKSAPAQGLKEIDVVCPGFAVDCLETLEEIAMTNKDVFMRAGGERYRYIPALNASDFHARFLANLIARETGREN